MAAKNQTILVKETDVAIMENKGADYISLTDIARYKNEENQGLVISHWLSTKFTVEFMGIWEQMHNPDFNLTEFRKVKKEAGSNGYVLTSKQWIIKTNAIGIVSKSGRYGGGTFAHKDIAFEFASWISASFKMYLIKEFQRLKEAENQHQQLAWNLQRTLAKINYRIHTDAIKETLIPSLLTSQQKSYVYADEADILNVALFGKTAKQWRDKSTKSKGNIRDEATIEQLVVLSNLESINSVLIKQGLTQGDRLEKLNQIAISQMRSLLTNPTVKKLK